LDAVTLRCPEPFPDQMRHISRVRAQNLTRDRDRSSRKFFSLRWFSFFNSAVYFFSVSILALKRPLAPIDQLQLTGGSASLALAGLCRLRPV